MDSQGSEDHSMQDAAAELALDLGYLDHLDYTQQGMGWQLGLDCLLGLTSGVGPTPGNWGAGLG